MKPRFLKRFEADQRGAALVEFAFVAPVLAAAVVMIGDGANLILHYYDMRAAVTSAAQYVMVGGSSLSTAQSIGLSAWTTRDPSGAMTVTNACLCSATVSVCNQLCPDQSVPLSYTTVQANSTYSGALLSQALSVQQVVRVR